MSSAPPTSYLAERGITYTIKHHATEALTAEAAARERGVRISQIVKCMVGESETETVVMLIPGDRLLKASKARKHLRAERLALIPPDVLQQKWGLTIGAISPLQFLGSARILMDPTVLDEQLVDISSGDPLSGIELESQSLRDVLEVELVSMISTNKAH